MPPKALLAVGAAMKEGAERYGEQNWRGFPVEVPINHAMRHLVQYLSGDRSEDHLGHAAANCLMAYELEAKSHG